MTVATDKAAASCMDCPMLYYRWRSPRRGTPMLMVRCIEGYKVDRRAHKLGAPGVMNSNLYRKHKCPGFVDMRDEGQGG